MFEMHGTSARVSDVEKQLINLREQLANTDQDALIRATTLNLIIYTESVERAQMLTNQVPENHPCRLIILALDEALGATLTAEPTIVCRPMFGRVQRANVCLEQIVITTGREGLGKAANAIQSLTIADQPTYLLWLAELDPTHPLLTTLGELSGGLIVDSADFADPEAGLRALAQLQDNKDFEADLFDLNWERLIPFCAAIAKQFEAAQDREALHNLKRIEVSHNDRRAEALLLFGWLADRLNWRVAHDQGIDTWTARANAASPVVNGNGTPALTTLQISTDEDASVGLNAITISSESRTWSFTYNATDHCIVVQAGQSTGARTAAPDATRQLLDNLLNSSGKNIIFERALAVAALLGGEAVGKRAGVVVVEDTDALTRMAARKIVTFAKNAIREKGAFTVALSGGSTPRTLYELLATTPFRDEIDWSHVHLFWGDERDVPITHTSSNQRMAHEALIDKVPLPPENVHGIKTGTLSADEAALRYEADIRTFFKLKKDQQPEFDLILLGMGEDGHTASLFPHTEALNAPDEAIFVSNPVPQLNTKRLTLTFNAINNAVNIMLLVAGKGKAEILPKVLHGAYRPDEYPVQRIAPNGGMLIALADRAAAARLR
jgi:6-phosphogluconolactonase